MARIYLVESEKSTQLTTSIGASDGYIALVNPPEAMVSGYGKLIHPVNGVTELIEFISKTSAAISGCTRGLAISGTDDSAGVGYAFPAGSTFEITNVHFYQNAMVDMLQGTSSTGYNYFKVGDGNTISASNRFWYIQTSSLSAFWGLSASGQMVVSEDGLTSYVISAGGSGLAAGDYINITGGLIYVDINAGYGVSGTSAGLQAIVNTNSYLGLTSAGLEISSSKDATWFGTFEVSNYLSANTAYFDALSVNGSPFKLSTDFGTVSSVNGENYFIYQNVNFNNNFDYYSVGDLNGQFGWASATNFDVENSVISGGVNAVSCNAVGGIPKSIRKSVASMETGIVSYLTKANGLDNTAVCNLTLQVSNGTYIDSINLYVTSAGADEIRWYDNTVISTFTDNTWYRIDFGFDGYQGKVRARVNGGAWTAWRTGVNSFSQVSFIELYTNSTTGISYWDDILIYTNGYITIA